MVLGHLGINPVSAAKHLLLFLCHTAIPKKNCEVKELNNMPIPWELIAPLIILQLVLMVFALVNCLREEETNGPKWMWILIIIAGNTIGPILYFIIGRKK